MAKTKTKRKRVYRFFDNAIDMIVVIVLLALTFCGAYAIWDNYALADTASAVQWQPYKPKVPDDTAGFSELRTINDEVVGWIELYGTKVDYPVCYSPDGDKYLNKNARGETSSTGAIFVDYRCSPDFSDLETIVYGHHMEANAMFGGLDFFMDQDYFDGHRYGKIYANGEEKGLDILCSLKASAYDSTVYAANITNPAIEAEYVSHLLSLAVCKRSEPAATDTGRIVVMSTCSKEMTDARTLVVARITDEVPANTFISWPNTGTGVDLQWTIFGIVWYAWLFGLLVIVSASVLGWMWISDRKAKKGAGDDANLGGGAGQEAKNGELPYTLTDNSSATLSGGGEGGPGTSPRDTGECEHGKDS